MLVSLYPNFSQNEKGNNLKNLSQTNHFNKLASKDKVSFGAIDPISLIGYVAKWGISEGFKSGAKINNFLNFKKGIAAVLDSPSSYKSKLVDTLFALSKTPANFGNDLQKSFVYEWVRDFKNMGWAKDTDIGTMHGIALDKIFPLLDDSVGANREAKKALMLATLDEHNMVLYSGYEKNFQQLNDFYYKTFKEQVLDKCFYSPEFLKKTCYEEQAKCLFNMELVETLNVSTYSDYLKRNIPEITREKQVLFQEAKNMLLREAKLYPNCTYNTYHEGFKGYGDRWAKYREAAFRAMVEECNFDKVKMSKLFNIDEKKAETIIKDMKKQK